MLRKVHGDYNRKHFSSRIFIATLTAILVFMGKEILDRRREGRAIARMQLNNLKDFYFALYLNEDIIGIRKEMVQKGIKLPPNNDIGMKMNKLSNTLNIIGIMSYMEAIPI